MNRFFVVLLLAAAAYAAPAYADSQGQRVQFNVNESYDATRARQVDATLRNISDRAYWYVDDRFYGPLGVDARSRFDESLINLGRTFDQVIYPKSRELWGAEPSPGVDGDEHVTVLVQSLTRGSGGYFESIHGFPSRTGGSNGREMFFISAQSVVDGDAPPVTAHEFQHLISFNQKELRGASDDVWLNEARSEYNIQNVGLNEPYFGSSLQARVNTFLRSPSDSLVAWPNTATDYGIAALFAQYLAERLEPAFLARAGVGSAAGIDAINRELADLGASGRFSDIFNDWMVASSLNDPAVDARYGYANPNLKAVRVHALQSVALQAGTEYSGTAVLQEWQPVWYTFTAGPDLADLEVRIQLSVQSGTVSVASVIATYRDGKRTVLQPAFRSGRASVQVPAGGGTLSTLDVAVAHGLEGELGDRDVLSRAVSLSVLAGAVAERTGVIPQTVPVGEDAFVGVSDGDLITHAGAPKDVYVVWGNYRRYLPPGVLELYGFQDRPVKVVDARTFFDYEATPFIRVVGTERVYAARPEGTKHWMNMTEAQFRGIGGVPDAIFTVNQAEADFYPTGQDVTR